MLKTMDWCSSITVTESLKVVVFDVCCVKWPLEGMRRSLFCLPLHLLIRIGRAAGMQYFEKRSSPVWIGTMDNLQQSLAAFNAIGSRRGSASVLNNLGDQLAEMGKPEEAKGYYEKALALDRETGYRVGEKHPIAGLADVLRTQGDLEGARKQFERALALSKETNDENFMAQVDVALASVALAEKRFADGASLARQATAQFAKSSSTQDEAFSQAMLARNLLGAGNLPEATSAAERAMALAGKSAAPSPASRLRWQTPR